MFVRTEYENDMVLLTKEQNDKNLNLINNLQCKAVICKDLFVSLPAHTLIPQRGVLPHHMKMADTGGQLPPSLCVKTVHLPFTVHQKLTRF